MGDCVTAVVLCLGYMESMFLTVSWDGLCGSVFPCVLGSQTGNCCLTTLVVVAAAVWFLPESVALSSCPALVLGAYTLASLCPAWNSVELTGVGSSRPPWDPGSKLVSGSHFHLRALTLFMALLFQGGQETCCVHFRHHES